MNPAPSSQVALLELWWRSSAWLWLVIKLSLSLGHGCPRWGTLPEHSPALLPVILLACVRSSKNKGRVGLCIRISLLPAPWQRLLEKKCFAAKRFTVKAFCTPGISSCQLNIARQGGLGDDCNLGRNGSSAPG